MDRGIYVAAGGAINALITSDVIANNLAGSNIIGFKKDTPVFSAYQSSGNPNLYKGAGNSPERVFVDTTSGNTRNIYTDFTSGLMTKTGNPLDFAIGGDGFFVVSTPDGERYTKRGDFILDKDGRLKTKDGYDVLGENGVITLTQGNVVAAEDGTLSVNGGIVNKLKILAFTQPEQLQKEGSGLFRSTGRGVNPLLSQNPLVMQGHLELSNVNTIKEMVSMIDAVRAYEAHMKSVRSFDDITDSVIRLTS